MTCGNNLRTGRVADQEREGDIFQLHCVDEIHSQHHCHIVGSETLWGDEPKNRSRKARTSQYIPLGLTKDKTRSCTY